MIRAEEINSIGGEGANEVVKVVGMIRGADLLSLSLSTIGKGVEGAAESGQLLLAGQFDGPLVVIDKPLHLMIDQLVIGVEAA